MAFNFKGQKIERMENGFPVYSENTYRTFEKWVRSKYNLAAIEVLGKELPNIETIFTEQGCVLQALCGLEADLAGDHLGRVAYLEYFRDETAPDIADEIRDRYHGLPDGELTDEELIAGYDDGARIVAERNREELDWERGFERAKYLNRDNGV